MRSSLAAAFPTPFCGSRSPRMYLFEQRDRRYLLQVLTEAEAKYLADGLIYAERFYRGPLEQHGQFVRASRCAVYFKTADVTFVKVLPLT